MVIHNVLLRGSYPHLGKGRVIMAIGILTLVEREGVVVMVIHVFLLRMSSRFLGKGRGGGTSHPTHCLVDECHVASGQLLALERQGLADDFPEGAASTEA